jgi:small multidrug resistance pump
MNIPPILILLGAILAEVTATNLLKASSGFTHIVPGILSLAAYGGVFHLLSVSLTLFPIGSAYAIWSGVGIAFSTLVGWALWHEGLNWIQLSGISLILVGVIIVNLARTSSGNG